ncbi:MAG: GNAT family N-acetyltransferase, partial [Bdellovibrionaceae bacterium]|nr:GNAT family N-acetyltransferase [Pseudobdellovibrionaceae bacterium]
YPTALTSHNVHNMRIITDADKIVSHAVLKPLIIKTPHVILKIGAIGSVVTDETRRNQGLGRMVLNDVIELARSQQCDATILWTNLFDFYRKIGFELAGTEVSLVIEKPLENIPTDHNLRFSDNPRVAPEAIFRLYSTHTVNSVRTVEDTRKFMMIPNTRVFTAWESDGSLAAYAIEGKGADLGGYVHEWGGGVSKLLPLLNWIHAKQNKPLTVICPAHASNMIQQMRRAGAAYHEGYLGMIRILNFDQLAAKIKRAFRAEGVADVVLERQNGSVLFGFGSELFTIQSESDATRMIFGPVTTSDLNFLSENARQKFSKILPLRLWIWGWDSV